MDAQIIVEGKPIQIDPQFVKHSRLIAQLIEFNKTENIEFEKQFVDMQTWDIMYQYFSINQFNPKPIIVKSNKLNEVFSQQDLQIIDYIKQSNVSIHKLLQVATYLNTPLFYDFLISILATEFFVDPLKPKQSLEYLQSKYPNVPIITKCEMEEYNSILEYII